MVNFNDSVSSRAFLRNLKITDRNTVTLNKYLERKYIQVWKGTSYMSYKISIERW